MAEKKYILRTRRPFASFRGTIRHEDGTDKFGKTTFSAAKCYQFDFNGRLEADEEVLADLKLFIDNGAIVVIKKDDVDNSLDFNKMKKIDIMKELIRLGTTSIDDVELDEETIKSIKKDVLLMYLEEVYNQKKSE